MQMHPARRISEALGSWLHLEFCCYRAGLFSEDSFKAAVGNVLSCIPTTRRGVRAHANFAHEALNPIRRAGRKREVDFALVLAGVGLPKRATELAIEAKWASSSHCTPENIFQDFLRLAAIKRMDTDAICIFVLAGNCKSVQTVLGSSPFRIPGRENTGIRHSTNDRRFTLDSTNVHHRGNFGPVIQDFAAQGFAVPASFVSRAHGLHPRQTDGGTVDFQAIAWEVREISTQSVNPTAWAGSK